MQDAPFAVGGGGHEALVEAGQVLVNVHHAQHTPLGSQPAKLFCKKSVPRSDRKEALSVLFCHNGHMDRRIKLSVETGSSIKLYFCVNIHFNYHTFKY